MRLTGSTFGWSCLLLLVALLPTTARADDDAGKDDAKPRAKSEAAAFRYAREQLVRRAMQGVQPDRMEADGVARARDQLKERRAEFLEAHRPSVEQADDLVDGEPGRGLIGEAARLYGWMAYVPPATIHDLSVPLADEDMSHPVIVYAGTEERPDFAALMPSEGETELSPDERASRELARRAASARLRDRTLDVLRRPGGRVRLGHGDRKSFLDLAADAIAARTTTEAEDASSLPATRLALTDVRELTSRVSRAWLAAREIQVRERLDEYTADKAPTGLVSAQAVEEKQQLADRLRAEVERLTRRRASITDALDWLVWAERQLTGELGSLGYRLEEAKAAVDAEASARAAAAEAERKAKEAKEAEEAKRAEEAAKKKDEDEGKAAPKTDPGKDGEPGKGDEPEAPGGDDASEAPVEPQAKDEPAQTPAEKRLVSLQLQEAVLKLKMRLLYLTVHRAVLRGQLYDKAIELAKEESTAAAGVADRFRSELNRMRREQQLEILEIEKKEIESLIVDATSWIEDPKPTNLFLWKQWKKALQGLNDMNKATRDAVTLRREFEVSLSPPRVASDEPVAEKAEGPALSDPMRRFRHPGQVAFDEKYVADAREALADPAFDRPLVALHHELVSERITALDEALKLEAKSTKHEESFSTAVAGTEEALAAVEAAAAKLPAADDRSQWLGSVKEARAEYLASARKAFEETLRGLDEKAEEANELLKASKAFERELRQLGPRSFGIRIQRDLDGQKLGKAYDSAQDTIDSAARWLTGRSDENIGTFARAHWLTLLACLALILAGIVFVRFVRRGLDRLIGRLARTVPALRFEPVTVRAEEANAKREKAEQELAAKAAEEEALRLVSKEEAGKAQRMGEGGYSGDAE